LRDLQGEIDFIKSVIYPVVEEHYPSKANHEKMSLYDLIAFGVMAHKHFDGVYKRAYRVLIEDLKLFPRVRYNKVVERLNRYEELLIECLRLFKLKGLRIVDSKPIETKKLSRLGRHTKRGSSSLIKEGESVGFNPLKGGSM
jgi:coproporphyrinogen III oxidase-like Fe-S oxidoreductase